jgi:hypothetical protein
LNEWQFPWKAKSETRGTFFKDPATRMAAMAYLAMHQNENKNKKASPQKQG